MPMKQWRMNADLNDWFYNHSASERAKFERKMSINWEEGTPEQKYSAVKAWIEITDKEEADATIDRRLKEKYERNKELEEMRQGFLEELTGKVMYAQTELKKREMEAYAKIEEMKSYKLQEMLTKLSQYLAGGINGVKESLDGLPKQFLETGIKFVEELKERKLLPAPRPQNEIMSLSPPAHCLLAEGPNDVVYTYNKSDGLYQRCLIAEAAHDRSVLGLQFINSDLLEQGGCPLHYSRTLGAQILGGIVPSISHEKCRLANGLEHKLG